MRMKFKICPAMVRCDESPRNAFVSVRTPVVGFYLFLKSRFMYQTNQSKYKLYACVVKEYQRKSYCPPPRPYTRNLKVYYAYQSGNFHKPFIILSGKWLEDAGFSVGDKICVTIKDNQLVIETRKIVKERREV